MGRETMDSEIQPLDPTFGQQRAFSLDDPLVDPNAIAYLRGVRSQALTTSAISSVHGHSSSPKHTAAIYDEPRSSIKAPNSRLHNQDYNSTWMEWFTVARDAISQETEYDKHTYNEETSMNLTLHHLKNYLEGHKGSREIDRRVLSLLQDMKSMSPDDHDDTHDDELEIDPEWAQSILRKFEVRNVVSLQDLEECIRSDDPNTNPPRGFKEWYRFLLSNEPTHLHFTRIIVGENLWTLVQYMSHDWVKDIHKQKNYPRTRRFSTWLLYILFHLPIKVTAEYVSNLRDLGKRCRKAISADVGEEKLTFVKNCQSSEMLELNIPPPPDDLDILTLTLIVVAIVYGQRDLITEDE